LVQSMNITGKKFEILLDVKKSFFLQFNYHISQYLFFLLVSRKRYFHTNTRVFASKTDRKVCKADVDISVCEIPQ